MSPFFVNYTGIIVWEPPVLHSKFMVGWNFPFSTLFGPKTLTMELSLRNLVETIEQEMLSFQWAKLIALWELLLVEISSLNRKGQPENEGEQKLSWPRDLGKVSRGHRLSFWAASLSVTRSQYIFPSVQESLGWYSITCNWEFIWSWHSKKLRSTSSICDWQRWWLFI